MEVKNQRCLTAPQGYQLYASPLCYCHTNTFDHYLAQILLLWYAPLHKLARLSLISLQNFIPVGLDRDLKCRCDIGILILVCQSDQNLTAVIIELLVTAGLL